MTGNFKAARSIDFKTCSPAKMSCVGAKRALLGGRRHEPHHELNAFNIHTQEVHGRPLQTSLFQPARRFNCLRELETAGLDAHAGDAPRSNANFLWHSTKLTTQAGFVLVVNLRMKGMSCGAQAANDDMQSAARTSSARPPRVPAASAQR